MNRVYVHTTDFNLMLQESSAEDSLTGRILWGNEHKGLRLRLSSKSVTLYDRVG